MFCSDHKSQKKEKVNKKHNKNVHVFYFLLFLQKQHPMKHILIAIILLFFTFAGFAQNQADLLYNQGVDAYNTKDFSKAIELFSKCDELNQSSQRQFPYYSSNASAYIAHILFLQGDTIKAKETSVEYPVEPVDQRRTIKSDSIGVIAIQATEKNDWAKAKDLFMQCAELEEEELGTSHYYRANTLSSIGVCYYNLDEFENAIYSLEQALIFYLKSTENYYMFPIVYKDYVSCCEDAKKYEEAISFTTKILGNHSYGKDTLVLESYYDIVEMNILSLHKNGEIEKAINCAENYLNNLENYNINDSIHLAKILESLSFFYKEIGDETKWEESIDLLLSITKRLSSLKYANDLLNKANHLWEKERIHDAYRSALEANDLLIKDPKADCDDIVYSYIILARCCWSSEEYEKALENDSLALTYTDCTQKDSPAYKSILSNISLCKVGLWNKYGNDTDESIRWMITHIDKLRELLGDDDFSTEMTLMALSSYYLEQNNYNKILEYCNILREGNLYNNHSSTAHTIDESLRFAYSNLHNYPKSIELGEKNLTYNKSQYGLDSEEYSASLHSLSMDYYHIGYYKKAIDLCKESLELRKKNNEPDSLYAQSLNSLSQYYREIGEFTKAFDLSLEAVKVQKKAKGELNPLYSVYIGNLGLSYSMYGDYKKAIDYDLQALEILEKINLKHSNDYASRLVNLAMDYFNCDEFKIGKNHLETALSLFDSLEYIDSLEYARCLSHFSFYYMKMSEYKVAEEYLFKAYDIYNRYLGERHSYAANIFDKLSQISLSKGKIQEASNYQEKAIEISKTVHGENSLPYLKELTNLSFIYSRTGYYHQAYSIDSLIICKYQELGYDSIPDYYLALNNIATDYLNLGRYDEAEKFLTIYNNYTINTYGIESSHHATALNNLSSLYSEKGEYLKAIEYNKTALDIILNIYGKTHSNVALYLNNLADNYREIGKYSEAFEAAQMAKDIYMDIYGEESLEYSNTIALLALISSDVGNFIDALRYDSLTLDIKERILGKENPLVAISYQNLSTVLSNLYRFEDAIDYYNKAEKIILETHGENSTVYATLLDNQSVLYNNFGDYNKALNLSKKAISKIKEIYGTFHPSYTHALNNLSIIYYKLGNYEKSIELLQNAINTDLQIYGEDNIHCATLYSNISMIYKELQDYSKSLTYCLKSLEIRESILGKENIDFANSLNNLGSLYRYNNQYSEAYQSDSLALVIYNSCLGEGHIRCTTPLNNIALDLSNIGYTKKALDINLKILKTKEAFWKARNNNTDYITTYSNICSNYYDLGDWDNLSLYDSLYILTIGNVTKENFAYLTEKEREKYWISQSYALSSSLEYARKHPNSPQLNKNAYDVCLLSKGILLTSAIQFERLIQSSGDSTLIENYKEWKNIKQAIFSSSEKRSDQNIRTITELQERANSIEQKLLSLSSAYGDFADYLSKKWYDVRESLQENEIAVEFAMSFDNGIDYYSAFLLRKDWTAPKCIFLGDEKELSIFISVNKKDIDKNYSSKVFTNKIWGKVIEVASIKEGDNIYFSPDGIIYQLGIEYLPTDDGRTMNEKYNIQRLSSTKELCFRKEKPTYTSATLYGGLAYDLDQSELIEESRKYESTTSRSADLVEKELIEEATRADRWGLAPLPATLIEVNKIEEILTEKNGIVNKLTDAKGNEESFKALSGKSPHILHVATHGIYFKKTEKEKLSQQNLSWLNELGPSKNVIDYSMSRTSLALSGATLALNNEEIPEGVEDGLLTAKEIAQLDLRNVDIAVLSACETGLGDITSDGVAGLQRGFKNAGVKSLLMSLWQVDDDATMLLMTEFYKNLMDGKSKTDSLKNAQQYLRNYEQNGKKIFSSPRYWASFILLDGGN